MKDFDLNSDPRDCKQGEMPATSLCTGIGSPNIPSWLLQNTCQSSPPQTSGNSDSTSNHTQSRSHGDAQVYHSVWFASKTFLILMVPE